jgi:alpha-tubulin suppressor-like RCC1 family protein
MAEHEQNPTDIIRYNERLLVCGSNKEGQIALGENTERVDTLSRILEGDFVDEIHDVICGPLHSVFLGKETYI